LGGFIGSRNDGNHYAKTARDDERKSTPKKIQIGEEGRRVFSESLEEKPAGRRSIPNRQFCIRSISTMTGYWDTRSAGREKWAVLVPVIGWIGLG
jgi:hypothetical protein